MDVQPYSFEEWSENFRAFAKASTEPETRKLGAANWLRRYFEVQYPDEHERSFKHARFFKALAWYETHDSLFDRGILAAVGSDRSPIGRAVEETLFRLFSSIPDSALDQDPPLDVVERTIQVSEQSELERRKLEEGRDG